MLVFLQNVCYMIQSKYINLLSNEIVLWAMIDHAFFPVALIMLECRLKKVLVLFNQRLSVLALTKLRPNRQERKQAIHFI